MEYLLDTCVIIDLIKGDIGTIDKMKSLSPGQIGISVITKFELRYGVQRAPDMKRKSIETVDAVLSEISIIDFRTKEAIIAAEIRNYLRARGTPIGPYDFLIAATAMANELILVTSNEKEFIRIKGLNIENWR